ncbi:G-protein-signaling modulator 2-like [Saccoglossus kowalevskii]|uniref:G-protein-signaling modulator 2-like n=1 Tax=Saccoglossus kowalevskii TaxID=10224 RepID=A0ABM0LZN2_SACKO|nr:PREDICTED: G-protein-signaling modulator 2-like [Saccoglossus kowalevskii]
MASNKMDASCIELALEGERLCKAGDCKTGVQFFEAAVQVGTDDLKTLSAIYSQLGNAYFYLQEYGKALEYHKHDLTLARTIGDRLGEAKASGNLGNTLKVLGKFDEAVVCCQRHLDISIELGDKVGEGRSLYNLGNVYHAKGKHAGRSGHTDPGDFPQEVKACLQKATEYYEDNLAIVKKLGDKAAQGRACGNLGNTHYLLGNFSKAIMYHEERLAIAKEFGDKSAERRAYSNLGNAHVFLGEFEIAAEYYKKTLQIARQLGDSAIEAQACYSLGNTFTLLRDYESAIEYHMKHLKIAQLLGDRVGEGRACWSLGNAHTALGRREKALHFATQHLDISREVGDKTGEVTAQMNLTDLRSILGIQELNKTESDHSLNSKSTPQQNNLKVTTNYTAAVQKNKAGMGSTPSNGVAMTTNSKSKHSSYTETYSSRPRRHSMELLELVQMTPEKYAASGASSASSSNSVSKNKKVKHKSDKKGSRKGSAASTASNSSSIASSGSSIKAEQVKIQVPQRKLSPDMIDDDGFFDILSRFQGNRMDDQRCSFHKLDAGKQEEGAEAAISPQKEEFLDKIASFQSSRINEQRASLPKLPGLRTNMLEQLVTSESQVPDDNFFEMLMRCQGSRIEDQRSNPPPPPKAPTVPDEDFFNLIQRLQSGRLEEQRSTLPEKKKPNQNDPKGKH